MISLFCCSSSCPLSSTAQPQNTLFLALGMAWSKKVTLSLLSREQSEGVGAWVCRSIGRPEVRWLVGGCFLLFSRKDWWDPEDKLGKRGHETITSRPVGCLRNQLST